MDIQFFQVVHSVSIDQCILDLMIYAEEVGCFWQKTDYKFVENQKKYSKINIFDVNIQILSVCEST